MDKELKTPKENVAKESVINVTTAQTRIKQIIIKHTLNNTDPTKELAIVIKECLDNIDGTNERNLIRNSLTIASRKWQYEFSNTFKILSKNLNDSLTTNGYNLNIDDIADILTKDKKDPSIRPYLEGTHKTVIPIIDDYRKLMQDCFKTISADPVRVASFTKNGKINTSSIRNRAEMAVRHEVLMGDLENFKKDKSVNFVWVSSHPNCSPRCAPWQGRLYSLDGTSGIKDGIKYEPIENALNANNGNGCISGYNCRHRIIPYTEGSKPPSDYSEEEIKREYAIDQKQRYYENNIRQLKQLEITQRNMNNLSAASKLRIKWKNLQREYEQFSLSNNRSFSRWRCVIDKNEKELLSDTKLITYSNNNKGIYLSKKIDNIELKKVKELKYCDINDTLVITKERYDHIIGRHPEIEKYVDTIPELIKNYDSIYLDVGKKSNGEPRERSINIITKLDDEEYYGFASIKLSTRFEKSFGIYNSVMSFRKIGKKRVERYFKKNAALLLTNNKKND